MEKSQTIKDKKESNLSKKEPKNRNSENSISEEDKEISTENAKIVSKVYSIPQYRKVLIRKYLWLMLRKCMKKCN